MEKTNRFLPEDCLIQILVRLPVVSLLRFKSVCKSWLALIQTSFFIDLHSSTLNSSSSSSNFIFLAEIENVILMLSEYEGSEYGDGYRCTDGSWHKFDGSWANFTGWDNFNSDSDNFNSDSDGDGDGDGDGDWVWDDTNSRWYWIGDDDKDDQEVFKVDDDNQLLLKVDNFELRSFYKLTYSKSSGMVIVGSCNGLICLHNQYLGDVSLWNPGTRQFRILPKSITIEIDDDDFDQYGSGFVAFGFDVKTKDYKVLLITSFRSKDFKSFCRAQVYSLSTDSWRLFDQDINSPLALPNENHGLYLNGSCFFIASVGIFFRRVKFGTEINTRSSRFINSFDFTKEIFTTMQLPDHDHRKHLFLRCLGGEKMALFTTLRKRPSDEYDSDGSNDEHGYEDCDIWVLNEQHGCCGGVNKESWTKLHSFQIQNSRLCEPIGISNNGKFALLDATGSAYNRSMRLYNLVTKEVKLDIPLCVTYMSKVYVYKPSLVSISSPVIG